jgi:hypothetical protein
VGGPLNKPWFLLCRPFTPEEDFTIQQAYEQLGNRWTKIAELVPVRSL